MAQKYLYKSPHFLDMGYDAMLSVSWWLFILGVWLYWRAKKFVKKYRNLLCVVGGFVVTILYWLIACPYVFTVNDIYVSTQALPIIIVQEPLVRAIGHFAAVWFIAIIFPTSFILWFAFLHKDPDEQIGPRTEEKC